MRRLKTQLLAFTQKPLVFGAQIIENQRVPLIISSIVQYFETKGFSAPELFQEAPHTSVDFLKRRFDYEGNIDNTELNAVSNPSTIMTLLRHYLLQLPHPLISLDVQEPFFTSCGVYEKNPDKIDSLKSSLTLLERTRYLTLKAIMKLFFKCTIDEPKYSAAKISQEFAQSLFHFNKKRKGHQMINPLEGRDLERAYRVTELLIQHYNTLFSSAEDESPLTSPRDSPQTDKSPATESPPPSTSSSSSSITSSPVSVTSSPGIRIKHIKEEEEEKVKKSSRNLSKSSSSSSTKNTLTKFRKSAVALNLNFRDQLTVQQPSFPSPDQDNYGHNYLYSPRVPPTEEEKAMKEKEKEKKEEQSYLAQDIIARFVSSTDVDLEYIIQFDTNTKDNSKKDLSQSQQQNDDNSFDELDDTRQKSIMTKVFMRDYYNNTISYLYKRKSRQMKMKKNLETKTEEEQLATIEQHRRNETEILRMKRTKMSIAHFEQIALIGQGGFGKIFLCRKKDTGEVLAIKKMRALNTKQSRNTILTRIKTERDVLARSPISSPWLVHLVYSFQDDYHLYLAMEFVPGGNLRTLLENTGALEEKYAKHYLAEMMVCVDTLHQMGYIHRDLKPENFLIDSSGHLKLADFGLSKYGIKEKNLQRLRNLSSHFLSTTEHANPKGPRVLERQFSFVGTPDYTAAEIIRGGGYDFTVDWWSLGVIFYEMMTGIVPFSGNTPDEIFHRAQIIQLENPSDLGIPIEGDELEEGEEYVLSLGAWNLILSLLCEPAVRIGRNGIEDFKKLPYFTDTEWSNLRNLKPPFIPELAGDDDLSYFELPEIENPDQSVSVNVPKSSRVYPMDLAKVSKNIIRHAETQPSIMIASDPLPHDTRQRFNTRSQQQRIPNFSFRRKVARPLPGIHGDGEAVDLTTE